MPSPDQTEVKVRVSFPLNGIIGRVGSTFLMKFWYFTRNVLAVRLVGTFFRQDSNVRSSLAASLYFSAPESGEDTKLRFFVLLLSVPLHPLLHPCKGELSPAREAKFEVSNACFTCRSGLGLLFNFTCGSNFAPMLIAFPQHVESLHNTSDNFRGLAASRFDRAESDWTDCC